MRVYAAGARLAQGIQTLHVCPAAHIGEKAACPTEWFGEDGEPLQITVKFEHGQAEVPDPLGKYLIAHKMARRTALIIPEGVAA